MVWSRILPVRDLDAWEPKLGSGAILCPLKIGCKLQQNIWVVADHPESNVAVAAKPSSEVMFVVAMVEDDGAVVATTDLTAAWFRATGARFSSTVVAFNVDVRILLILFLAACGAPFLYGNQCIRDASLGIDLLSIGGVVGPLASEKMFSVGGDTRGCLFCKFPFVGGTIGAHINPLIIAVVCNCLLFVLIWHSLRSFRGGSAVRGGLGVSSTAAAPTYITNQQRKPTTA